MISITLEEAYDYFGYERIFSEEWLMASMDAQERSLKMATNQINRLKFSTYSDDNKEKYFKNAICEQAIYLIQTQNTQRSRLMEQGVTSFSVEGLSESYDVSRASKKICSEAMEYLKPYLLGCACIC